MSIFLAISDCFLLSLLIGQRWNSVQREKLELGEKQREQYCSKSNFACMWRTFQVLHFNYMKLSSLTCFWVISIQKNFVTATFFTLKLKLPVYQIPPLKVTTLKTDVEFVTKVTILVRVKY